MLSRRSLLATLPLASFAARRTRPRLGCQTNAWPIRAGDFADLLGVLRRIRALGYEGFETSFRNLAGRFGEAAQTRAVLEKTGLRMLGVHIFLLEYDQETALASWDLATQVADGGAALGTERLILSGRGLYRDGRVDAEALRRKAGALNRIGDYCRRKGLGLAYHNHDVEFRGGGLEIEGLLKGTDPGLVHLMWDAGHAYIGGVRPVEFFTRHARRIDGLHLRDFRAGNQVPLGQGEFDLKPLAAAVRKAGWQGWLVNEEERPNDVRPGDAVVEPALRHLREVFGI